MNLSVTAQRVRSIIQPAQRKYAIKVAVLEEARQMISNLDIPGKLQAAGKDLSGLGQQAGTFISDKLRDPDSRYLTGAAIGAGVGGLGSLAMDRFKKKDERSSVRAILTGSLMGGAAGAGSLYASDNLSPPASRIYDDLRARFSKAMPETAKKLSYNPLGNPAASPGALLSNARNNSLGWNTGPAPGRTAGGVNLGPFEQAVQANRAAYFRSQAMKETPPPVASASRGQIPASSAPRPLGLGGMPPATQSMVANPASGLSRRTAPAPATQPTPAAEAYPWGGYAAFNAAMSQPQVQAAPAPAAVSTASRGQIPASSAPRPLGLAAPSRAAEQLVANPAAGLNRRTTQPSSQSQSQPQPSQGNHLFTDNTGKHTTSGRIIYATGDTVRIMKENGRTTTVPMNRLSAADREYAMKSMGSQPSGNTLARDDTRSAPRTSDPRWHYDTDGWVSPGRRGQTAGATPQASASRGQSAAGPAGGRLPAPSVVRPVGGVDLQALERATQANRENYRQAPSAGGLRRSPVTAGASSLLNPSPSLPYSPNSNKLSSIEALKETAEKLVSKSTEALGNAGSTISKGLADPNTRYLYGAGVGAAAGGLGGLVAEAAGNRKRKKYLGSALSGAAGGALLGGAGTYVTDQLGLTGAVKPGLTKPGVAAPVKLTGDGQYDAFVAGLPTDPIERAAALKEYANQPDPRGWVGAASDSIKQTAADNPVAAAAAATGLGGASSLAAGRTAKNWTRVPEGADKLFKALGRPGYIQNLTNAELTDVLSSQLSQQGFTPAALRQIVDDPNTLRLLRGGKVDTPEFKSAIERAWNASKNVGAGSAPPFSATFANELESAYPADRDAAIRATKGYAANVKAKMSRQDLQDYVVNRRSQFDDSKAVDWFIDKMKGVGFSEKELRTVLMNDRNALQAIRGGQGLNSPAVSQALRNAWQAQNPRTPMPPVSPKTLADMFSSAQKAGKAVKRFPAARTMAGAGIGAAGLTAALQMLLSGNSE